MISSTRPQPIEVIADHGRQFLRMVHLRKRKLNIVVDLKSEHQLESVRR